MIYELRGIPSPEPLTAANPRRAWQQIQRCKNVHTINVIISSGLAQLLSQKFVTS